MKVFLLLLPILALLSSARADRTDPSVPVIVDPEDKPVVSSD